MKVIDAIKEHTDTVLSFEILPLLKGAGIDSLYAGIDPFDGVQSKICQRDLST